MANEKKVYLLRNLIEIKWIDSNSSASEWEYLSDLEPLEPVQCHSVGYLIEDNKDYKTLVQSISHNQILGRITIPFCSILSIADLRTGKFLYSCPRLAKDNRKER